MKRILLDECLPKKLSRLLSGYEVKTVQQAGWSSEQNGELLTKARDKFDVFITVDRNLVFQQNLTNLPLAVVVLVVRQNRLQEIMPLIEGLRAVLQRIKPGEVIHLGASESG